MSVVVRSVRPGEGELVRALLHELAVYEKLTEQFAVTAAQLEALLFCAHPRVFCEIAEWEGAPAGLALWNYRFPSFVGRLGIWLEDLVVREAFRGKGIGLALFERLAAIAREQDLHEVAWNVLDWNTPAIRFYESLGARRHTGWDGYTLSGTALAGLADRTA